MTIAIRITPELVEWVQERLNTDADEAQNFAEEFAGVLYFTGAFTESERLAAADLLEACQDAYGVIEYIYCHYDFSELKTTLDKLANTIAKYKGQQ